MTVLAYERMGQGAPLVCLHPIGLDRTCWAELSERLTGSYQLVCVDLAGHGASPDRHADQTVEDDAALVLNLLADLDLGPVPVPVPVPVIGVSFGGMVAQALAVNHPEQVAALICCACPPGILEQNRPSLAARGTPALEGGMEAIVETTMARWFTDSFRDTAPARTVRQRLMADDPKNYAAAWQTISRFDLRDRLGGVTCPALCLAGGADPATPRAAMEALSDTIPGARLKVIDGAPHMLHIETADAVAAEIRAFLEPEADRSGQ
ncbi:alpha/beta fold hydrolase [Palleronia abyssalis]|uniref:3-oxoadipate enol-lactonase 2 n=1 Tax=Palleronia abyssalis TaxID=1501240 RepID=A0A2R8BZ10_9RHOB|nr:alpha/beta hydrolase [Palleronia abyssalis]SPJ25408.1 3-oxoadipate enol-lactonase 2 [Palleronia abyssalis]